MCPASMSGTVPSSAAAPAGSCMTAMSGGWQARREPGVAGADDPQPVDRDFGPGEHDRVPLPGHCALRGDGVVVALDEDIRHVECTNRPDEGVLRRAAVVGEVAGVDDEVDIELAGKRVHDVPRGRVVMDVGDVKYADRAGRG